jgi:hypothetical protein
MQLTKHTIIALLILVTLAVSFTVQTAKAEKTICLRPDPPSEPFVSCDKDGNKKTTFDISENVYVKGGSFPDHRNQAVDIYIIPNGLKIKTENAVAGPATNTTDAAGHLPITCIWKAPLKAGKYDVWVDVNQNGKFDNGDTTHYYYFCCCYLFFVVPENYLGPIGAVTAMIGALIFFRSNKISKLSKNSKNKIIAF